MPGSPRERRARPGQLERLSLAAQPAPTPIPLTPSPSPSAGRSQAQALGYPTAAEVQRERGGERPIPAGFYRPAPGEFDCDCGCCSFCTRGLLPNPAPMPTAAPQRPQDGPPTLPLPREVARGLAARPATSQGLPPKGSGWGGLDAPFSTLPPLAQIAMTLVQEAVAAHGESAMTVGVAYKARRVAHVLLHGTEMPWQEGKG